MKITDIKKGKKVLIPNDDRAYEIQEAFLGASGHLLLELRRCCDGQKADERAERCEVAEDVR